MEEGKSLSEKRKALVSWTSRSVWVFLCKYDDWEVMKQINCLLQKNRKKHNERGK
jgi:hypothetical protein